MLQEDSFGWPPFPRPIGTPKVKTACLVWSFFFLRSILLFPLHTYQDTCAEWKSLPGAPPRSEAGRKPDPSYVLTLTSRNYYITRVPCFLFAFLYICLSAGVLAPPPSQDSALPSLVSFARRFQTLWASPLGCPPPPESSAMALEAPLRSSTGSITSSYSPHADMSLSTGPESAALPSQYNAYDTYRTRSGLWAG